MVKWLFIARTFVILLFVSVGKCDKLGCLDSMNTGQLG